MKAEALKDLAFYESLPYTVVLRKDDEGDFVARVQELPGCTAHGETEAQAIENLRPIRGMWLEESLAAGHKIPEPENEAELPSGKWLQRVPRRLHRDLVNMARRDNISLNQLVTSMLAEAVTMRTCAGVFETLVSSTRAQLTAAPIHIWWVDHLHEPNPWSTTPRVAHDSFVRKLERVKSLKFGEDPIHLNAYTESYRQLTSK